MTDTPDDYDDDDVCPNCGGEGYVADCFEEWACIDPESGCDDCIRRCDWCSPRKSVNHENNPLSAVLADALNKAKQP